MTKEILILDGGMSREIVRLGGQLRQPEWSALALMETPDIVRQVHAEFVAAGADIITTNSYALVPFHIGEARFRKDGLNLARLSGRLAREAADACTERKVQVAGCLPPIFGSYEPQRFDPSRVQDYLSVLVEGLDASVDIWLGETLSLIAEAQAVIDATAKTQKPVWISFTLEDSGAAIASGRARLRSGETIAAAAEWALASGVAALLFNCSQPEVMRAAVAEASAAARRANTPMLVGVYANAFEPRPDTVRANEVLRGVNSRLTPQLYARFASQWVEAGAAIVGGCCGIGVSHIHHLAATLKHGRPAATRR